MDKKPQDSASREADKYIVRFPDGMRDQIAEAAKASKRSMNAEIVARLQQSFEPAAQPADAQFLIAKWNRDLLDVELQKQTLRIHLKEVALSLFRATLAFNAGRKAEPSDVAQWVDQVKEAFEASDGVELDAQATLEELERANRRLNDLAEKQGVFQAPHMETPTSATPAGAAHAIVDDPQAGKPAAHKRL